MAVLTPVFNEERFVEATVATMQRQEFDGSLAFVFIDGRSTDQTRAILERLAGEDPRIRVLDNPARDTPRALNIGLRSVPSRFVARMDAHTLYPPRYLADAVARLGRGDVAWVSGPQLARGAGGFSRLVELALSSRLGVGGAAFRRLPAQEIEVDTGFTGVWTRELLEQLGGWAEDWPVNQDAELAARVRARGGRIVCLPEMAAEYTPRDTPRRLARQYWRYGRYRARTSRHHPGSMRRSHLLAPGLVVVLASGAAPSATVRRVARALTLPYLAALAGGALGAVRADPRRAAGLPVVWAIMHVAWGSGFVAGSVQFGVPLRAIISALRPNRQAPGHR